MCKEYAIHYGMVVAHMGHQGGVMNCDQNVLAEAIAKIDALNATDPTLIEQEGTYYPAELLYGKRMSEMLAQIYPREQEDVKVAVRAQHIARWKYPRSNYPEGRVGYLTWRKELYAIHARITVDILRTVGHEEAFIRAVEEIMLGKVSGNGDSQKLEDVACLVFLQHYSEEFVQKYEHEKVISIVQKTWGKMSEGAQQFALGLPLTAKVKGVVSQALS